MKWNPDTWAKTFKDAGAKYVVLTTKHHEGFTLWPSTMANPTLPQQQQHATRDLVGALTESVRKEGLKMGLYYSGGFDWTFVPGPITSMATFESTRPQSKLRQIRGRAISRINSKISPVNSLERYRLSESWQRDGD